MHLVFDFDGTLADSKAVIHDEMHKLLARYKIQFNGPLTIETLISMQGIEKWRTSLFLWKHKDELTEAIGKRMDEIEYIQDMPQLVREFHLRGHGTAILSSNHPDNIRRFVESKARVPFAEILGVEGIVSKRRTLEGYLRRHGLSPREMIYITDDYRDIASCKQIGIPVICVTWGLTSEALLRKGLPNAICHTPTQLKATIETLIQTLPRTQSVNTAFSLKSRLHSFKYAFRGIWTLVHTQHNARLHLFASLLVLGLGFWVQLNSVEWSIVLLAMALVWCAEALNTAVEFLCDLYSKDYHPLIEKAKDVAAAAVLVCSIGAALAGFLIFAPKILALLAKF